MTVSRELIPPSDDLPWPLHRLPVEVDPATLPERFTCPFCYRPHPLCVAASASVQAYIASRAEWRDELAAGKMFGVLIVRDRGGAVGFLTAFSGNLAASNHHAYFVPPVYDMLQPDGFFLREDRAISELNDAVAALEQDARLLEARRELHRLEQESQRELSEAHAAEVRAHEERERLRAQTTDAAELAVLTHASQHERALLYQLKRQWAERLAEASAAVAPQLEELRRLKAERHSRSAELQQRLFAQFRMRNARGEVRDLNEIFAATPHRVPPAGAASAPPRSCFSTPSRRGCTPWRWPNSGGAPRREARSASRANTTRPAAASAAPSCASCSRDSTSSPIRSRKPPSSRNYSSAAVFASVSPGRGPAARVRA